MCHHYRIDERESLREKIEDWEPEEEESEETEEKPEPALLTADD